MIEKHVVYVWLRGDQEPIRFSYDQADHADRVFNAVCEAVNNQKDSFVIVDENQGPANKTLVRVAEVSCVRLGTETVTTG